MKGEVWRITLLTSLKESKNIYTCLDFSVSLQIRLLEQFYSIIFLDCHLYCFYCCLFFKLLSCVWYFLPGCVVWLVVYVEKAGWLRCLLLSFIFSLKKKFILPVFAVSLLNREDHIFFLILCKSKNIWMFIILHKQWVGIHFFRSHKIISWLVSAYFS